MFEAAIAYLESEVVFNFPDFMDTLSDTELATTVLDLMDGKGDTPELVADFMDLAFYAWQRSGRPVTEMKHDIVTATKAMMTIFLFELLLRRQEISIDRTTYTLDPDATFYPQES